METVLFVFCIVSLIVSGIIIAIELARDRRK